MRTLLSEARAWREIARIIDTERPGASDTVFLCLEADDLWYRERIDDTTCDAMRARVMWWNGNVGGPAYSREDGSNQDQRPDRVLAALWLSLEAEDDRLRVSDAVQAGETKTSPDDQMAAILTPSRDRGIV